MSPGAEKLREWRECPVAMVRDLFGAEPDPAQSEALSAFPTSPRLALQACTGSGKTATLAWLAWNFMLTRPRPKIGVASINGANLKSTLWAELARWRDRSSLLQALFETTATTIYAREAPETWKLEARTWKQDADASQIGNSFRGLHADYVMWLLDETGAYPASVLPVCEAIFSGSPKEAHIVQAGNPTHLAGPLYEASTSAAHLWRVIRITADPDDPHRTPRVSVEHAREQITLHGRDNPYVLVNIFGRFPPASFTALIGPDEVRAAMARGYSDFHIGRAAKIFGVDVARYGDDSSVICRRRGPQVYNFIKRRSLDSTQGAGLVAREASEWGADAIFVDDTGGFGSGWIDQLRQLGRAPIGVHFAGEAHDHARYFNKRCEMYFDAVAWIKRGGALPECPELLAALTQTTYVFKGDKMLLEPKDELKKRLGYSPDEADAFALTFAEPVAIQDVGQSRRHARHSSDYDPYAEGP